MSAVVVSIPKMKKVCTWTLGPFLALLLVLLNFGSTNSAIVPKIVGAGINLRLPVVTVKNGPEKENITLELFAEAVQDYVDLSIAYHGPAPSEALREKRTSRVFQRIANRTRSGVKSLRSLFSGRRRNKSGSEDDEGGKTRRSFGKFFSNMLNRILVFLTKVWDRITGIFRGRTKDCEDGEEGGTSKLINRIRTGASALLSTRLRGADKNGGGASGILASLTGLIGPKSTSEPHEVDYSDISDKDLDSKGNLESEGSTDLTSTTSLPTTQRSDTTGNYNSASGNPFADFDNFADASVHTGQFVPIPMDIRSHNPNFYLNGAPVSNYYSASPAQASPTRKS